MKTTLIRQMKPTSTVRNVPGSPDSSDAWRRARGAVSRRAAAAACASGAAGVR